MQRGPTWHDRYVTSSAPTDSGFPPRDLWRRDTWIRACMVSTLDGSAVGHDGVSGSISTTVDHDNFVRLRRDCDVILVGAGTLRTEDYARATSTIAVVTNRLDLSPTLRLFAPEGDGARPCILTTDGAVASAPTWLTEAADVIACGEERVDLERAITALAARGLTRVHCEGGPSLLGDLAGADLLDELFLTVTPELLGTPTRILSTALPTARFRFCDVREQDGTIMIQARHASVATPATR